MLRTVLLMRHADSGTSEDVSIDDTNCLDQMKRSYGIQSFLEVEDTLPKVQCSCATS